MKKNQLMQSIREKTPPEVILQVDLQVRIANRIIELLEERNMTQKDFAKSLGKTETEVSRWLSGTHNMTLATIAKIAVTLDDNIIQPTGYMKQYRSSDSEDRISIVADSDS